MIEQILVSRGITKSEQYLIELAKKSFLSLWCYSNVFTDRKPNAKGDGKELCDLLVVFENNILIFSDKQCEFKNDVDVQISWQRWYRNAIKKSINQVMGAYNWINKNPERLFLDSSCKRIFPLKIIPRDSIFHLIAVTRGSNTTCNKYLNRKSSGSLQIDTRVSNDEHANHPFTIGRVLSSGPYIHVLDEFSLDVILHELDTIYDFVNYLKNKEKLLTHPTRHIQCSGEEQLVAIYLTSANNTKSHDFTSIPDNRNCVLIEVGFWEFFKQSPPYLSKKQADKKSYIWDSYIENAIKPVEAYSDGMPITNIFEIEPVLRIMASEPRIYRRQLAQKLLDGKNRTLKPGGHFFHFGHSNTFPNTAYVFLTFPCPPEIHNFDHYCRVRQALLLSICIVYLSKLSNVLQVIGIASEPFNLQSFPEIKAFSEEIILYHNVQGNERADFLLRADEINKICLNEFGINFDESLKKVSSNPGIEYEFPWFDNYSD